jgi:plastocyanin
MSTRQAAEHEPGRDDALEHEMVDAQTRDAAVSTVRTRRRFLRQALGGAGVLALSASGAIALRRVDAKDDDDDDNSGHGGDDHGDDHSGSGSGSSGSGGDDNSGRNGSDDPPGDDHGGDRDEDDDHDDDNSGHGGDDDDNSGRDGDDDDDEGRLAGTPVDGVTEVRITDDDADAFQPQMITVDLGAEVTFFNDDDDDHTATSASFDTGTIAPGGSATITLDEPGSHFYACRFHPEMTGTIFVRDEDGNVPGATPAATPRAVDATNAETETVSIVNFAFDPAELTVPAGTTVTWENTDTAPHTATAEDGSFDTGRIDQNASASVTFDEPGTFAYVCSFHPNMMGTITVE